MTTTMIFLTAMVTAIIREVFFRVKGREMFPPNPKGPLYKWFNKPNGN